MSNYNYGLEPGVEGQGSSKLRFVLIFVVISALTAALLWWFWPDKEEKDAGKKIAGGQVNDAAGVVESRKEEKKESSKAPVVSEPVISVVPPAADGEKKQKEASSGTDVKKAVPPAADPTDPPLPDKGIVTPADKKGVDLPVVPADGEISEEQKQALADAEKLLAGNDLAGAEKLAEKALDKVAENSLFYRKAWGVLTKARMGMVFRGKNNPHIVRYRIRSGDSLSGVAGRFFTTVELLRKRNNISGSRIFVGRQLVVVPGDWKIVVSKKYRLLKLFRKTDAGEKLFALWEVGIGRMGKTPAAEFAIASRIRHPDWYLPDGRVFKYGDAENQLGDYFLKLAPASAPGRPLLGYGIHGAKDETAVGRSLSSGCIRMRNGDVESLYYLVPNGCRVSIVEE